MSRYQMAQSEQTKLSLRIWLMMLTLMPILWPMMLTLMPILWSPILNLS